MFSAWDAYLAEDEQCPQTPWCCRNGSWEGDNRSTKLMHARKHFYSLMESDDSVSQNSLRVYKKNSNSNVDVNTWYSLSWYCAASLCTQPESEDCGPIPSCHIVPTPGYTHSWPAHVWQNSHKHQTARVRIWVGSRWNHALGNSTTGMFCCFETCLTGSWGDLLSVFLL